MRAAIVDALRRILKDDLLVDTDSTLIAEDDGLQSVVGLDSVGFVELRYASEQKFEIEITDEHYNPQNFRSLGALATLIERLQAKDGRQ